MITACHPLPPATAAPCTWAMVGLGQRHRLMKSSVKPFMVR